MTVTEGLRLAGHPGRGPAPVVEATTRPSGRTSCRRRATSSSLDRGLRRRPDAAHRPGRREFLDRAGPQLKVVSNFAVGFDNIDVAGATARGIPVGNTPGVLTEATADLALALLMAAARASSRAITTSATASGAPGGRCC